ncbi:DNA/RNA non-specific endonuclease [Lentzea atacamensis]|uniref:DNA/RNA non-specific endonuclease n=1 Tax=Lentzea atacamensis TaxID=531938 RepID=A0A316IEN7_9PSEU|nr:DNA/RNA non-specific endonuclease [Lentzea atacamensis]PWK90904.1 DNA/RNA non-specific endonuclease [Lentzea atacamensis]
MACVVPTRKTKRPKLGFNVFGLDTSNRIVRCHLIRHKLNGSNTDPANFAPCHQDPTNNSWMWQKVEAKIAAQVDANNPVLMGVKPVYTTNNPRPDLIVVNAVGENGWTCGRTFPT